jgi:hypothetical protein
VRLQLARASVLGRYRPQHRCTGPSLFSKSGVLMCAFAFMCVPSVSMVEKW